MRRVFTANGSWDWPTGVTVAIIEALGGGGCGGWGAANPSTGGGGKAGSYGKITLTKGAESSLTIVVGQGGAATVGNGDEDGTASTVTQGSTLVLSAAGGKGVVTDSGTGATVINGSNTEGDLHYEGGNGADASGAGGNSGAGGGAAGPGGVGGNASGTTAGTAHNSVFSDGVKYGGDGGAGVAVRNVGNPGVVYGGAGAGGSTNQSADKGGGAGANGIVVISWTIPEPLKLSESAEVNFEQPAQPDLDATPPDDGLKLSDVATAIIDLVATPEPSDSLKIVDTGNGRTELTGVIHITESANASIEELPQDLSRDVGFDGLNTTDAVEILLDPLNTLVADDSLEISDAATAGFEISAVPADDSLKVSDAPDAWLETELAAPADEGLTLSEPVPVGQLIEMGGPDISATPTADALTVSDSSTATLDPLWATPGDDGLVVSVSVEATFSLAAAPAADAVELSDAATTMLWPLAATPADESLTIVESNDNHVAMWVIEPIHITDSVTAERIEGVTEIDATPPSEALHITDSGSALLVPLSAAPLDDSLKLTAENPSANIIDAGALTVSRTEPLTISDAATTRLVPLQAAPVAEGLKVSDDATPQIIDYATRSASAQESLKVSVAPTARLDPLLTSPANENLKLSESATVLLPVLRATPTVESLKVDDQDPSANVVEWGTMVVSRTEPLHVSESAATLLNPLRATVSETLHLTESASAGTILSATPANDSLEISDSATGTTADVLGLSASATESAVLSDSIAAQLDPLDAVATDGLAIGETVETLTDPLQRDITESVEIGESLRADSGVLVRAIELMGSSVTVYNLRGSDARIVDLVVIME